MVHGGEVWPAWPHRHQLPGTVQSVSRAGGDLSLMPSQVLTSHCPTGFIFFSNWHPGQEREWAHSLCRESPQPLVSRSDIFRGLGAKVRQWRGVLLRLSPCFRLMEGTGNTGMLHGVARVIQGLDLALAWSGILVTAGQSLRAPRCGVRGPGNLPSCSSRPLPLPCSFLGGCLRIQ